MIATMSRFTISSIILATATVLAIVLCPWAVWVIVAVTAAIFVALTTAGVCCVRWQWFVKSVCRMNKAKPVLTLTFDDGPDPACTARLLDWLASSQIRAVFFCIGQHVQQHPDLACRIVDEGHQLGNHTQHHSVWNNLLPRAVLWRELADAQQTIERITGQKPRLYRPPFGLTNPRLGWVLRRLDLTSVGWTIRSFDTCDSSAIKVANRIVTRLRAGAIILLHDGHADADRLLDILSRIVDAARDKGYTFDLLDVPDSAYSTHGYDLTGKNA